MENKCLNCGKPVKNKYCNVSCQNTHQCTGRKRSEKSIQKQKEQIKNDWKSFTVKCHKCDKEFEIKEYKAESPKKEKYYCCRSCANSRPCSIERKNKVSDSAKKSEKVKLANKLNGAARKGFYFGGNENSKRQKITERVISKCLHCNGDIEHKINEPKKYHKECWLKCSGGIRKGSSRGKSGWYKGYWCDSSYELAWVIYQLEHNIEFKRNEEGFDYIFENVKHKYYPDFILNTGTYVEIKNYHSELTDTKIEFFPHKIDILYKEDIKKDILPYVFNKYGKDFIRLYENYKEILPKRKRKEQMCLTCEKPCVNKYCSNLCSSKGRIRKKRPHNFLPFIEAREIVRKLNIKTSREWAVFVKSDNKIKNIPVNPFLTYKNEWVSWYDWLGILK